jgi:DNA repair protein RadA/Sms
MKTKFVCQNCGALSPKWYGRCPSCGTFDSMVEEAVDDKKYGSHVVQAVSPVPLSDVPHEKQERIHVGISELDRVLGGGLVKGSLILLGGDPGIGKSTLMLQLSGVVARAGSRVLYVNGEESSSQVRMRAERLGIDGTGIDVLSATDLDAVLACATGQPPGLMVVDSIQTVFKSHMSSAPGSVGQVRECGSELMRFAKAQGVTTVIIGHVTKYGAIAGPKTLEHIVDTVLYFEGEKNQHYRIIRAIKNRFGPTNEIGVFEMTEQGLREVMNPSSLFISNSTDSGSAIVSIIEGSRPLIVEVQALTSPTFFNYPQRVATGIDYKRLSMLLAVLERRIGMSVYGVDCYVNIVGGIKVFETSSDLGIVCAIASSMKNQPIDKHVVMIGEVGLGGEVRQVYRIGDRLKEAENMGMRSAIVPHENSHIKGRKIGIIGVKDVKEAVKIAVTES